MTEAVTKVKKIKVLKEKTVKPPKLKREKSTTTKGHYVRNADLFPAIIEAKELGRVTDKLIIMIQMIADHYSRKANFVGYSFREDMVSAAVENLCKNALKFDHIKYSNPFAFYTTAIHNSFLQFLANEKKQRKVRDMLLIDAGSNPSFNFLEGERNEEDFEVKESDEHYYDMTKSNNELEDEIESILVGENTSRNEGREPSQVKIFKPADDEYIEIGTDGSITFKKKKADIND